MLWEPLLIWPLLSYRGVRKLYSPSCQAPRSSRKPGFRYTQFLRNIVHMALVWGDDWCHALKVEVAIRLREGGEREWASYGSRGRNPAGFRAVLRGSKPHHQW